MVRSFRRRPSWSIIIALVAGIVMAASPSGVAATQPTDLTINIIGPPSVVFDSATDPCHGDDVADTDARAFRDSDGMIVMFALHYQARPLRGPDFAHLTIDCHVALDSPQDPEPAHHEDLNFMASLWTDDGRHINALVHNEYHADDFNRCHGLTGLACWYNMILSYRSNDGGRNFIRTNNPVVAAAPFTQDVEQGRHRGFFAPSNIVADGRYKYFFGATTGWSGQPYGACLFRTETPARPETWRAFDGRDYTIKYYDPYVVKTQPAHACMPIKPFIPPVGSVVRQRGSNLWIAISQASKNDAEYPVDGFYYSVAHDLLNWGAPKLLLATPTISSDLCKVTAIDAYPSIIDDAANTRMFQDVGSTAYLYYARARVDKCQTGQRLVLRQKIEIQTVP